MSNVVNFRINVRTKSMLSITSSKAKSFKVIELYNRCTTVYAFVCHQLG